MELKKKILELVCRQNACTSGIDKLMLADFQQELIDLYFRHIDFCLARKTPNNDFIKENFDNDLLRANGVYLNHTGTAENRERVSIIGQSEMTLIFDGYSVGRVYVADSSKVEINASGNAFVVVDCVDKSNLMLNICENAKVIVNAYRDAKVNGNATIVRKKTATYDLRTR